jgi:hypothetical protein
VVTETDIFVGRASVFRGSVQIGSFFITKAA